MSLQEKISAARAIISAEVNTINDYHNDEEGQESCDDNSDGDVDNNDCEKHFQEFDMVIENFKQSAKGKK